MRFNFVVELTLFSLNLHNQSNILGQNVCVHIYRKYTRIICDFSKNEEMCALHFTEELKNIYRFNINVITVFFADTK